MSEHDFQTEIFNRLGRLEQGQAALQAMLSERCDVRHEMLQRHESTLQRLVAAEHRQTGERTVYAGLLAMLGAIGGVFGSLAARWLP